VFLVVLHIFCEHTVTRHMTIFDQINHLCVFNKPAKNDLKVALNMVACLVRMQTIIVELIHYNAYR